MSSFLLRFVGWGLSLAVVFLVGCEASRSSDQPESSRSATDEDRSMANRGVSSGSESVSASESAESKVGVKSIDAEGLRRFIAGHQGQVVLIDFWATWCGVCREGFPEVVKLGQKYVGTDLVISSIALDDAEARPEIERFLAEQAAPRPAFISSYGVADAASMDAFQILSGTIPTLKLYDRTGVLRFTFGDGQPFTHEEIDVAVRQLLAE